MKVPILEPTKAHVPTSPEGGDPVATFQLHPLPSRNALLARIEPPLEPTQKIDHVPCDIVLVIDVSGSMDSRADVPGEQPSESAGLSVLDLVKHAAMTIIETLNQGDRLGVVVFDATSRVVQELTTMTDDNKNATREKIKAIRPLTSTNLWHGIRDGIKVFNNGRSRARASSIMVLTDGQPNHMNPPAGFVRKLETMLPLPTAISTFGFGYGIQSGLLKSIAEIGGGNYAFIPDAGMIGTVFVHAVANLQSTFATEAILELQYNKTLQVEESTGATVDQKEPTFSSDGTSVTRRIYLGNIQFGQSRDLFLKVRNSSGRGVLGKTLPSNIAAKLSYNRIAIPPSPQTSEAGGEPTTEPGAPRRSPVTSTTQCSMLEDSNLPDAEVAYHESRSRICEFLTSMFPIKSDGNRTLTPNSRSLADDLKRLVSELPASNHDDARNKSLIEDLAGDEPHGQVSIALGNTGHLQRWGQHYLPSLLNAHVRQMCNSFRDPGPLLYGADSPLFVACRTRLDSAFDNLPAPEPSLLARGFTQHYHTQFHVSRGYFAPGSAAPGMAPAAAPTGAPVASLAARPAISMARYRNINSVCFAGSTPVELVSGTSVAIRKLRRGTKVRTPAGPRKVAAVLKTYVRQATLCRLGDVLVTPWHPVSTDGKTFAFPATATASRPVLYTGFIYSIMLQRDAAVEAHGVRLGGRLWGVTLGHGLVDGSDVRAHAFFGDYNRVGKALLRLGVGRKGVVRGGGVVRDKRTGLVSGFKRDMDESRGKRDGVTMASGRVEVSRV